MGRVTIASIMARAIRDVEFEVSDDQENRVGTYKTFEEAAAVAMDRAISRGSAIIDVLVWSEAGARALGGSDAVERYREDPDASVFDRYEVKVNGVGRVP